MSVANTAQSIKPILKESYSDGKKQKRFVKLKKAVKKQ
jgi:hypothetical protein